MPEQGDQHPPYCFCELAPLYVLGSLEEAEHQWVESQIQADPELAEEIADYQAAMTAIPYSLPQHSLPTGLKERVFRCLTGEAPPLASNETAPTLAVGQNFNLSHLRWRPFNAPGFEMAKLHLDREARELSCLVRAAAGLSYPAHHHAGPEEILMLAGELRIGDTLYGPGDYIRSTAHSVHPSAEAATACLFFLKTSLDNEMLA